MRKEEAEAIGRILAEAGDVGPVLELGSSTLDFRTREKPHVDAYVHAPLRERGIKIVTSDLKAAAGVDICGDIYAPDVERQLKAVQAKTLLCCNILEHLTDRAAFAAACDRLLQPGGLMIVTVPHSYPYHLDPIDTYYRPTPNEIVALFPGYVLERSEMIQGGNYWSDIGRNPLAVAKVVLKCVLFVGGIEKTKARAHRLLWLARPYKEALAVLRKPARSQALCA